KKLGTLVVVVLKARHLKDSHRFYKQDPYASIRLGESVKQTKVDQRGGQHPVWDEEFRIPVLEAVPGLDLRTLKVSAFSKESRADELIGEGLLDISDTLKRGEFDDWVKLELNGAFRGEVFLEMTYYSADPPLARRPSKFSPRDRLWRPPATPPK
ncbi:C2 domain-containing protein, partial [Hysterangium stoloniferum]